jgi:predicted ribosome quality control (RQC) complex YloA/Tae2 family protein
MRQETIQAIVAELEKALLNHTVGRVFQLSPFALAIDFGVRNAGYLFVSAEPAQPRIYLIKRSAKELEKQSQPPALFAQALRSVFAGARLEAIAKDETERVVRLRFLVVDELGERSINTVVCQLTGRSANLFLLDPADQIRYALRSPKGEGQQPGQIYQSPAPQAARSADTPVEPSEIERREFPSLSQALDDHYTRRERSQAFANRVQQVGDRIKKELAQRRKLKKNLERDLAAHGDPEQHKRLGDLLLANIATAVRTGNEVSIKDYYSEGAPTLLLEVDKDSSLQDEAGRYFSRYTKAKRAAREISARLATLEPELSHLQKRQAELETIVATGDEAGLRQYEAPTDQARPKTKKKQDEKFPGVRRYLSSDDYEILVGRAAQTNDRLTFKIARPHDLWLHAADYPGSHVVIRNPTRNEVPHRTIIEAAQLAAKFSQAGDDSKVTVHYTSRKFLTKPKGVAPGLVRMSSFKTITVTPAENSPRL